MNVDDYQTIVHFSNIQSKTFQYHSLISNEINISTTWVATVGRYAFFTIIRRAMMFLKQDPGVRWKGKFYTTFLVVCKFDCNSTVKVYLHCA